METSCCCGRRCPDLGSQGVSISVATCTDAGTGSGSGAPSSSNRLPPTPSQAPGCYGGGPCPPPSAALAGANVEPAEWWRQRGRDGRTETPAIRRRLGVRSPNSNIRRAGRRAGWEGARPSLSTGAVLGAPLGHTFPFAPRSTTLKAHADVHMQMCTCRCARANAAHVLAWGDPGRVQKPGAGPGTDQKVAPEYHQV